jgi:hypothetical protein
MPSSPPPPSIAKNVSTPTPNPPAVAFLVELLMFNGWPFKDYWAYWVRSHTDLNFGV